MSLAGKDRTARRLALEKIGLGAIAFNEWRKSQRRWIQIPNHNFDGSTLDGIDFSGVKFTGSSFKNASLKGAVFTASNVNKVDFSHANLTNADFQGARLYQSTLNSAKANGCNFFASLRDGWSIQQIECSLAWINRPPAEDRQNYELFSPGEFELCYGGTRIKIAFDGDLQPIDLLALPFYAKELLARFPDKKLVFAGLSALGEPALEFRVEEAGDSRATTALLQQHFDSKIGEFRQSMELWINSQLSRQEKQIDSLVGTLRLLRNATTQQSIQVFMGKTYIQKQGVQGENIHAHSIQQLNLQDSAQLGQLSAEFEKLLELMDAIPTATSNDKEVLRKASAAAKAGDSGGVVTALKGVGKWVLGFSEKVGAQLVAAAIKEASGM